MSTDDVRIGFGEVKNRFNSSRKVSSESSEMTSLDSPFQIRGAAAAKARLPAVDSLTEKNGQRKVMDLCDPHCGL